MLQLKVWIAWLAIGLLAALLVLSGVLGYQVVSQAQEIGRIEQQRHQLAADLQSSASQLLKQQQLQQRDQQLFAELTERTNTLKRQSEADQQRTRAELQDEACANTPLPESVVNRLRDRIHRQARDSAGATAG